MSYLKKGTMIGFGTAEARKLPTCGLSKEETLRRQQVKPTVAASTEFVAEMRALRLVVVKSREVFCASSKEAVQLDFEKLLDSETSISGPSSSCPSQFSKWCNSVLASTFRGVDFCAESNGGSAVRFWKRSVWSRQAVSRHTRAVA